MGLEALAASIVGRILVPYFAKGLDAVTDGLVTRVGESAANGVSAIAERIAIRVKEVFAGSDDEATLDQLKARPEAATPLVTAVLTEKLEQDSALAEELERLLEEQPAGGNGASVGSIMGEYVGYVDARGGTFENTNVIGQVVGQAPPPPPRRP